MTSANLIKTAQSLGDWMYKTGLSSTTSRPLCLAYVHNTEISSYILNYLSPGHNIQPLSY